MQAPQLISMNLMLASAGYPWTVILLCYHLSSMDNDSLPDETSGKICMACGLEFAGSARFCSQCASELVERLKDPLLGKVLGERYEILEVLGKGGMGVVYKARHQLLDRMVAIKTLHPAMVSNPQNLARFQREAKAASSLSHPHIIIIHDFGLSAHGVPFLVMDLIEGKSLASLIDQHGHLAPERALPIFAQVCDALSHAHKRGVIHRDLKPSNIMLVETDDAGDSVRLLDFGIAKLLAQPGKLLQRLTQTGQTFGSPLYMSPEQCMGQELDGRSDLYALGCVIYETLTGDPPLRGDNVLGTIFKHINDVPVSLSALRPDLTFPEKLEAIVMKALEKDPHQRYRSAGDMKVDLINTMRSLQYLKPTAEHEFISRDQDIEPESIPEQELKPGADPGFPLPIPSPAEGGSYESDLDAMLEQRYQWQLKSEEQAYGPDSRTLIGIMSELANLYKRQRRYAEAARLFERLSGLTARWEGPESPAMYGVYLDWGDTCYWLEEYQSAESHYSAALLIAEKNHGAEHPDVVSPLQGLGDIAQILGRYTEAKVLYERGFTVLEKSFGESNPLLVTTLAQLALVHLKEEDFEEAKRLLDRAIELRKKAAGGTYDPESARLIKDKASVCWQQGEYDEAEALYRQAIEIQKALLGPQDLEVACTLEGLGWDLFMREDYAEAEKCLLEALDIRERRTRPDDPEIVKVLTQLGSICRYSERLADAERYLKRAFFLSDSAFGPDSFDTAKVLFLLGDVFRLQERFAEAEGHYKRVLSIREVRFGKNHPKVAEVLESMAWLQEAQGRQYAAEIYYVQAIEILENSPETDKKTFAFMLRSLAGLYQSMGQQEKADGLLKRAEELDEPSGWR